VCCQLVTFDLSISASTTDFMIHIRRPLVPMCFDDYSEKEDDDVSKTERYKMHSKLYFKYYNIELICISKYCCV